MTAPRFHIDSGEIVFDLADALDAAPLPLGFGSDVSAEPPKEEPMTQSPQAFSSDPIDAPRWVAWSVVAVLLAALVVILGGCCTHGQQAVHVVREAKILLGKPYPGAPRWERAKDAFFADAEHWELEASSCCVAPVSS